MRFLTNKFIPWLDKIVRPVALANLPMLLVVVQAATYIACLLNPGLEAQLLLYWERVFAGEVWRLLTYMFVAPVGPPIFAIFYFYILYMMANYLESAWGTVRLCSFVYLGLVLVALSGLLVRSEPISGNYMYATIFLAFATMNPNFTFMIMFILPIQVKYLAWLQAAGYLYLFVVGSAAQKVMVVAALGNYLIFFADTLFTRGTSFHRRLKWQAKLANQTSEPRHVCYICGINSDTHPDMDFRYCSKCVGTPAYCQQHLANHEHLIETADTA